VEIAIGMVLVVLIELVQIFL